MIILSRFMRVNAMCQTPMEITETIREQGGSVGGITHLSVPLNLIIRSFPLTAQLHTGVALFIGHL